MDLAQEATLPRDNGELVFAAPWEARALAIAVTLVEQLGVPWDAFRSHLIREVGAVPDRPYYESWAAALEAFLVDQGMVTPEAITAAEPTERAAL